VRARRLEDVFRFPEPLVLAGALGDGHGSPPYRSPPRKRRVIPLRGIPPLPRRAQPARLGAAYVIIHDTAAGGVDLGQIGARLRRG
jgi:hypothetical protein